MGRRSDRRAYDEQYEGERRGGSRYPDEQYQEPYQAAPGTGARKKRKGGFGSFLTTLLLVIAIGVFGYSAYKLYGYWQEYRAGESEYSDLNKKYVQIEPAPETAPDGQTKAEGGKTGEGVILSDVRELETEATLPQKIEEAKKEEVEENGTAQILPEMYNPVDFRELQSINPEVIGWIRVGGAGISYPVAQTDNNDFYLHHTFKKEAVFSGCIFLNCDNSKYFTDQNTIIYGHNMKECSHRTSSTSTGSSPAQL